MIQLHQDMPRVGMSWLVWEQIVAGTRRTVHPWSDGDDLTGKPVLIS